MSGAQTAVRISSRSVDLPGDELATAVARALAGLRFGSVEIVVHDGRVAHIERRERFRVERTAGRVPDDRTHEADHHDRTRRTTGGAESTDEERSR